MNEPVRVAAPPTKPLLIYDGDCRFCEMWIKRWKQTTGDRVEYTPFQSANILTRFPEIPRERFETAVQFLETDGRVYSGAAAVLRARAHHPKRQWLFRAYENWPWFAALAEKGYAFVARRRTFFSRLTRIAYGNHVEAPDYFLTRWIFLRALGLVYLIAFLSLWSQIHGLIGSNGILPAEKFMTQAKQQVTVANIGLDRFRLLPTLCWFNASDGFLTFQCAVGVVLAVFIIIGIAPAPSLFLLWLIYLSLSAIGREFMSFQWDILLLETGFLAIFFAPRQWLPRFSRETAPSRVVVWLLRWLVFRLMFESGWIKILSDDPLWKNLTALTVHYETQPLPTWVAWHVHQLPAWIHVLCCFAMFIIELIVPFFFFAPRRLRFIAASITAALQIFILLTGNYTFFNWLTLTLCLMLLDDFLLTWLLPKKWLARCSAHNLPAQKRHWLLTQRVGVTTLTIVILLMSSVQLLSLVGVQSKLLNPLALTHNWLSSFRSVNRYGLFAMMTPRRPELVFEGSNDGINWIPYEFKYKPGDLSQRPRFVAPHQPRLDWQMWFAALSRWQDNPWLVQFIVRLQNNSPEVIALMKKNPFPKTPPRYVRAMLYEYRFTNRAERKQTGYWWKYRALGEYLPAVSLQGHQSAPPPQPVPRPNAKTPPPKTTTPKKK